MTACCCSNRACELFGCQRDAADRARLAPFAIPTIIPPGPQRPAWPNMTIPITTITESDVRRIVAEEIAKAMAIHPQGEEARRSLGGTGGAR